MTYYIAKKQYGTTSGSCSSHNGGCTCQRADVHPLERGKCRGTCRR